MSFRSHMKNDDHSLQAGSVKTPTTRFPARYLIVSVALVIIILGVYQPTMHHPFISLDDNAYVVQNANITGGYSVKSIVWAFTTFEQANWHPITWLSHMADIELYGLNPEGHHISNIIIHTLSSLLLLFLLNRLTKSFWRSAFVAALFALHPLHVESVAWVAERKDVLSAFFGFVTLLLYAEFTKCRKPVWYLSAIFFYMISLMAKPMLVTLPFILLLLDLWPLNRYRDDASGSQSELRPIRLAGILKEKIPFFICACGSGLVTLYAQDKGGATRSLDLIPLANRIENAVIAYVRYMVKMFWPDSLAVLYPIPTEFNPWHVAGSLLLLVALSIIAFVAYRRRPYLTLGWFWFIITLLPVIGLIQVGGQAMADRYTYVPLIGLFIVVTWGAADLTTKMRFRREILGAAAVAVLTSMSLITWHQQEYWQDSVSLYRHTLEATSNNYWMNLVLGDYFTSTGDLDGAVREYRETVRINPDFEKGRFRLAVSLAQMHAATASIEEFRILLKGYPDNAMGHFYLGQLFAGRGEFDESIRQFQEAIRICPNSSDAHNCMGIAYARKGAMDIAINELEVAVSLDSANPDAAENLRNVRAGKVTGLKCVLRE